jgi:hypothetical protein
MKKIAYHGTDENFTFDEFSIDFSENESLGFHFGTKRAAVERVNKFDETVMDWDIEDIEYFFDENQECFFECEITLENPWNNGQPISENDLCGLNREELIAGGFDGLAYINDFEDAGSISYIVFEKKNISKI